MMVMTAKVNFKKIIIALVALVGVILAAVITELEGVDVVMASTVERFFTADLAFLQDMYHPHQPLYSNQHRYL